MGAASREKRIGNCYVTSESLFHLLGGKRSGWKPCVMRVDSDTHWFLKHDSGLILDPTAKQFGKARSKLDYSMGRGCGFLTRRPSARAALLMEELLWQ